MKYFVSLLNEKPHLGFLASGFGGLAGLLTFLKLITPLLGFFGALFGCAVGLITLLIKLREWRKGRA